MSSTVRSYGYIAAMVFSVGEDKIEELHESLYDANNGLEINYDGTLLFVDLNQTKPMSEREDIYGLSIGDSTIELTPEQFVNMAKDANLPVFESTVQPYNCIWYNGSDNPVSLLSKEEFLTNRKEKA